MIDANKRILKGDIISGVYVQYQTVEKYDAAIEKTEIAIDRILSIGSAHENSSGGSSRKTSEADIAFLEKRLSRLNRERESLLYGFGGCSVLGAAW